MASRRSFHPARALAALCTAAVTGVAVVPGVASADPRPAIATVQRQLSVLEREAALAAENYHEATDEAAAVAARLKTLREEVAAQERRLADTQRTLGQLAASSYRAGGLSPTMRLLFTDDPETFLAQVASIDRLGARQAVVIRTVTAAREKLDRDRQAVAVELEAQERVQERLATEKKAIEDRVAAAQQLLDRLKEEERQRIEAARRAAAERAAAEARAARDALRSAAAAGGSGESAVRDAEDTERGAEHDEAEAVSESDSPRSSAAESQSYSGSGSGSGSGKAAVAVQTALAQVGDAYVYAANGPDAFDCSGLTTYAWRAAGVSLPRSSRAQYAAGRKVSGSDLQPGDLVYYYSPISHVGIYIGGGKLVHAANPRTGVNITSVDSMPFAGATRP